MTDVPTERVMEAEYIADHALMVDIQLNAYVGGAALPCCLLAAIGGIALGGWWFIPGGLAALVFLIVAAVATERALDARALAGAHAVAATLARALQSHSTGDDK